MLNSPLNVSGKLMWSLWFAVCIAMFSSCLHVPKDEDDAATYVNPAHLDKLYDEIVRDGDTLGVIHIYCEYPDYTFVDDADEGYTCVDDVSRAAIYYVRRWLRTEDPRDEQKVRRLLGFMLHLQAPNGYFYNFMWPDGEINTDGVTSRAEPNWWSWRALWAMGELYEIFHFRDSQDPALQDIHQARQKLVDQILTDIPYDSTGVDTIEGLVFPTWLPGGADADEAAILLTGLEFMSGQHSREQIQIPDPDKVERLMRRLGEGIVMMQVQQRDSLFDGAFMSADNLWHAYGNAQAYALLRTRYLDDTFEKAALYEASRYYPTLISSGGWDHYFLRKDSTGIHTYDRQQFAQIAYARRPMIWTLLVAYGLTNDIQYMHTALDAANWFFGKNPAGKPVYDIATGRCYDGINSPTEINLNAGAESTIEALLALQAMESVGVSYDAQTKQLIYAVQ